MTKGIHYAPGDNIEHVDVGLIGGAEHEIDLAAYVLTDWPISKRSRGPPIAASRCASILTAIQLAEREPTKVFHDLAETPGVQIRHRVVELRGRTAGLFRQKKALPYRCKTRTCVHTNKTPIQPYKSPPRTTSTVFEMGSQEKTQAPVAAYIAMDSRSKNGELDHHGRPLL